MASLLAVSPAEAAVCWGVPSGGRVLAVALLSLVPRGRRR
jgi:hypothetical protein